MDMFKRDKNIPQPKSCNSTQMSANKRGLKRILSLYRIHLKGYEISVAKQCAVYPSFDNGSTPQIG